MEAKMPKLMNIEKKLLQKLYEMPIIRILNTNRMLNMGIDFVEYGFASISMVQLKKYYIHEI
jgi:hypothetical protein